MRIHIHPYRRVTLGGVERPRCLQIQETFGKLGLFFLQKYVCNVD